MFKHDEMMKCIHLYHLSGQNFDVEMQLSDWKFLFLQSFNRQSFLFLSFTSYFTILHRYYGFFLVVNELR